MSLLFITAIAAAVFLLAYRFYGAFLAKPTPALLLVMLLAASSVCAEERSKLLPTKQEAQKVCGSI